MNEERQFWASLDRRLSELESKMSLLQRDYQRDFTDLQRDIRENTARVNNGLSPSIQSVIKENGENRVAIEKLTNLVNATASDMRSVVTGTAELTSKMLANFKEHEVAPVKAELDFIKRIFIYGTVAGVVGFLTLKGTEIGWKAVFDREERVVVKAPLPSKK
jgi:hypothetical protein